jgi:uncharacterized protein (TIGR03435 family)
MALTSQTTPAASVPPAFEVATIKVHPSGAPITEVGIRSSPDGVEAFSATLAVLVEEAYGLRTDDQVIGIPAWARDLRFDVQAKMSTTDAAALHQFNSSAQKKLRQQMMKALLAERFNLTAHSGTKQAPVYELVVAKNGFKLKETTPDSNPHAVRDKDGNVIKGYLQLFGTSMTAQSYTMHALANFLSQPMGGLGRPVVDKTALTGAYDFTLPWSPNLKNVMPGPDNTSSSPEDASNVFAALGDIGLHLQTATGNEDFIMIDHVEQPSDN